MGLFLRNTTSEEPKPEPKPGASDERLREATQLNNDGLFELDLTGVEWGAYHHGPSNLHHRAVSRLLNNRISMMLSINVELSRKDFYKYSDELLGPSNAPNSPRKVLARLLDIAYDWRKNGRAK